MSIILNISLPVPLNQLFSYIAEGYDDGHELIGRRALVPFGKRIVTGVVVGIEQITPAIKLKKIIEILDEKPVFSTQLLNFTKSIAEYYLCSWGETLKAAMPQGISPKSITRVKILIRLNSDEMEQLKKKAPKRAALLEMLYDHEGDLTVDYLESQLNTNSVATQITTLEEQGIIEIQRVVEKTISKKFQKAVSLHSSYSKDKALFKYTLTELENSSSKQALLMSYLYLEKLKSKNPILVTKIVDELKISQSTISTLVKKGIAIVYDSEVNRSDSSDDESLSIRNEYELPLTYEQDEALKEIVSAMETNSMHPFLLHGITGSGKTLVYIHAIKKALSSGKTSLMLVPEISLTPQLIDRFRSAFSEKIAVLHSKMSQGERYDAWRMIQRNEVNIVIGVRSAIFAPLDNLGLIIVDEEHEPSYKQDDPVPRYNARDAALLRAREENCTVVLGSATPSLESMYNAITGKYKLLEITERADGANLPDIRIVDTLIARRSGQMLGLISKELITAIADRVNKKEGVILFLNRRGFSSQLECPDCGYVPECKNCSVSLTYHKVRERLQCHYCGYTAEVHKSCPACGFDELKEIGTGTQKIEEDLKELLLANGVDAKIQRMDLDTTSKKGSHRRILQDFASGNTDILLGTQMVAKGLDFDRVTLVGVVNPDLQLFIPDFRATERTFQLLTQVSGRAGRSRELPGEVIVQTAHSNNFAIRYSLDNDYKSFYEDEIKHREDAKYPPFSRFIVIEFSGEDEKIVQQKAVSFLSLIPKRENFLVVLGVNTPTLSKLRNKYRRIIIIKNLKKYDGAGKKMRNVLENVIQNYNKQHSSSRVHVTIDIDSYSII
jgi:primosomal protein N' (replication factor Y)